MSAETLFLSKNYSIGTFWCRLPVSNTEILSGDMTVKIKSNFSLNRLMATTTLALALSGVMTFVTVTNAEAQRTRSADAQPEPSEGRQFSAKAGGVVNEALTLINEDQHQAGLSKLNQALQIDPLNAYEKSTIYQMQGASYYELNQYAPAISAFNNAINAGGLLPNEADSLRVNIAQLMIANGQYAEGAQALERYLNNGGQQKPQYVEMLTQAWVQSENFSKALPWAEKWFNSASPKERKHFDLLNYLYNNLNMPGKQADIVKQMIGRWPEDKTLWDAWASMLANGGREQEAFEVTKMLYLGGALSQEADLLKVVQYYSFYDMPFQAAQILEQEMNRGRIAQNADRLVQLSDLFRQSREYKRAIPILEKAASASGKAKLFADLGEAYYNESDCSKAESAFTKAIDRGFDAGKAWMLIGTCRYEGAQAEARPTCKGTTQEQRNQTARAKKRNSAVEAFSRVPVNSQENGNAKKWRSFIEAEGQAVEDRCVFEANTERELCYIKIKQAYDAEIFTGGFKLEDESCLSFKEKYDSIYRVKVGESE